MESTTITAIRLYEIHGKAPAGEPREERIAGPLDVYPDVAAEDHRRTWKPAPGQTQDVPALFLQIETDAVAGESYVVQSLAQHLRALAPLILKRLKPQLVGQDALRGQWLWDRLYLGLTGERDRMNMLVLAAIDAALWDIRGKCFGAPAYRLLGGPTRDSIPAYASALSHSHEPEKVHQRAREFVARGYKAQKWFFRYGAGAGREGMEKNLQLVRSVRQAVGDGIAIMFDAHMSWDVPYALEMARRMAPYDVKWLEEPVLPERLDLYAQIRRKSPVPIAGGEQLRSLSQFHEALRSGAVDYIQPDVNWIGGITHALKVCALASAYEVPVCPHDCYPTHVQVLAAQPPNAAPLAEHVIHFQPVHHFWLKQPVTVKDGAVCLPQTPGAGMEIDERKVERKQELA
jgi:L-alanine-DL-glutamate epimerase-like enolase superfamily enzyme